MGVVKQKERGSLPEEVAGALLVLVWDYVELVAMLGVVVGGALAIAWRFGLPWPVALGLVGLGLVLVIMFAGGTLAQLGRRGRARRQQRRFRRRWSGFCDRLGWSERLTAHAGVRHPDVQLAQIPDLLAYKLDAYGVRLELKPLASQPRDKWARMADALARDAGYPHQRWSEPRPGVLRIDLIARELPKLVTYEPAMHDGAEWDDVVLAEDAAGQLVVWKPSDVPHVLVAGVTQGGKGSALRQMMLHGLRTGWQLLPINPKGSGEFGWVADLDVPVITDVGLACRVMQWVQIEMKRRQGIVGSFKVNNWRRLPNPDVFAPLMILIDEGSSLLLLNKANKETAKQQEIIGDILARVAMQGRAVGIHIVLAAQRPDVANLGPAGGQLRMNLDGRIAVCNVDGDGKRMMFEGLDDPDIMRTLDGTKGRALMTRLSAGSTDVFPGQIIYADEEELVRTPPLVRVPQLAAPSMPLFSAASRLLDDGTAAA